MIYLYCIKNDVKDSSFCCVLLKKWGLMPPTIEACDQQDPECMEEENAIAVLGDSEQAQLLPVPRVYNYSYTELLRLLQLQLQSIKTVIIILHYRNEGFFVVFK